MKRQFSILLAMTAILFCAAYTTAETAKKVKTYTVDQLIAKAPSLVGQTVQVKGICKHVCATTGRKLFLLSEDGTKMFRFNAGSKITKFDPTARGKEVSIIGVVAEQRITKEDLDQQEAKAIEAERTQSVNKEHCSTEAKANGESEKATPIQLNKNQKDKLLKQITTGGKNYLAFYTIDECNEYSIAK